IPFVEGRIRLRQPDTRAEIMRHCPSGKVPALKTRTGVAWDSLAILEYLAEHHAEHHLWPHDREARAAARCISAEMHSGFVTLRNTCPWSCLRGCRARRSATRSRPISFVSWRSGMMRARVSAKAARSCSALSPMPTRCSCRWRRVSAPMASIFPDSVMTAEFRPMPRRCLRFQRWPNGPKAPRRKSGLGLQAQPRPRLLGRRADEFARSLRADGIGPQIVFVGSFDAGEYAVPRLEASLAAQIDVAVDLGRVPMRTRDCALIVNLVD